ncbi:DUF3413 domain-containing protein [Shewanella cyperi]|uniref:DUF3413 domain-containing protein n=1 Tax=Shewanella cyperi TaxID=2814292 RepID=A0A974XQL0_9GAMM|nr:DUF3413 domain-containing protein [Shewanella cyperi]QSX28719.1 DUF3413 domain-containing protein [Shewanella cyperi]
MAERKQQLVRDKVSRLVNWGHWFAAFNGLLAIIVGSRYLDTVGYPETLIGWGYLSLSSIGQFSFLAFMVYLLLVFPVTLLLPYSKILRGLAATVATLALCLMLYDTIVYDDYGMHLSPFAFDLAWADLNALLHGTSYIITPLAIIGLELTAANFLWKRIDKLQKRKIGPKVAGFIAVCFISSHLVHIWADAADVKDITRFDDVYPLFYPATAKRFMENHGLDALAEDLPHEQQQQLQYPVNPLQCQKEQGAKVLLLAIDSLRADMVTEETMPFLSIYARDNQQFSQHYSGGNQAYSGLFSLLYGLQGSYLGNNAFAGQSPLLTRELARQGYSLARFMGETNDQLPQKLGIYDDFSAFISDDSRSSAAADLASIQSFRTWQADQTGPWFALLNLSAPENYDTPVGFAGTATISAPEELKPAQRVLFNQYRQSLRFIDASLQSLLTSLDDDTVVIITGLNGKLFTSNQTEARRDLSPQSVRVPLVIHWPGEQAARITHRTSHHGLVPLLMTRLLGCSNAITDYSAGRQLETPSEQQWVYVGDNRYFAIYQNDEVTVIDRHGKYRIYDGEFNQRLKKKMSAPELIQVMREGRRLYKH